VRGFDRRWTIGCGLALGVSALGWLLYAANGDALVQYLQEVEFDADTARAIASFSLRQVGWYLLFLTGAVALVTLVLSGALSGSRAPWGGVLLGLWLAVDLGRANRPWIVPVNYRLKYASDPVVEFLRAKPHEQRVAILPDWFDRVLQAPPQWHLIHEYYRLEWAQHHFLYNNIQSLDLVQMPRMPEDLLTFESALQPARLADAPHYLPRRWQLTNTRYLLGAAGYLDFLNQQLDPERQRFRVVMRFDFAPKPEITRPTKLEELTAVPRTNGTFALFEFTGALPRVGLYAQWQVQTNDAAALSTLVARDFDPAQTVLVARPIRPPAGGATNAGQVAWVSYAPKHLVFKATTPAPAVLLLNDRFDPNWQVTVDGRPAELLRCNYIMRGVLLDQPGAHQVEFRFVPPLGTLYVSLAAIGLAVGLAALLLVWRDKPAGAAPPPPAPAQA